MDRGGPQMHAEKSTAPPLPAPQAGAKKRGRPLPGSPWDRKGAGPR